MSEPQSLLGTLGSWLGDALLCGALMAFGAILPVFGSKVHDVGAAWRDVYILASVTLAGAAVGVLFAAPLWAASRILWRLTPLLSMALGPCAGAISALLMFYTFGLIESGRPLYSTSGEKALLMGFGAFALGPPWVGYLAVRARGRGGLWVAFSAGVWAIVPALILLVCVA